MLGDCSKKETYEDYLELFKPLDEPQFIICDGHKSISNRIDPDTGEVLGSFRTHHKLFSVRNMIIKLQKKNMLFLFLGHSIPNNSNYLEGGINSPLKNLKRCHRGISLEHEKRMWEWYLLSRSNLSINDFIKSLDLN